MLTITVVLSALALLALFVLHVLFRHLDRREFQQTYLRLMLTAMGRLDVCDVRALLVDYSTAFTAGQKRRAEKWLAAIERDEQWAALDLLREMEREAERCR